MQTMPYQDEIADPPPIIYERCKRCGVDVPRSTEQRHCADCNYTLTMARVVELRDEGVPDSRIAEQVGIHHRTIRRALGPRGKWREAA